MKPTRRFVDLSIHLENDVLSDTLPVFMAMLPGTTPADYLDGEVRASRAAHPHYQAGTVHSFVTPFDGRPMGFSGTLKKVR